MHRQSARDELFVAELEVVEHFRVGQLALHSGTLEASREDVPAPLDIREEERVTDRDRNLVPQRGGTLRVPGE